MTRATPLQRFPAFYNVRTRLHFKNFLDPHMLIVVRKAPPIEKIQIKNSVIPHEPLCMIHILFIVTNIKIYKMSRSQQ